MPYTVKTTTTWGGPDVSDDQIVAKVKELFAVDFRSNGFDPTPMLELRQQHVRDGNMLARGTVMAPDGKSLTVTMVWKSKGAYQEFVNDPTTTVYRKEMNAQGYSWTTAAI